MQTKIIDYELSLLKYVKDSQDLSGIDSEYLLTGDRKSAFDLLRKYHEKNGTIPTSETFKEYALLNNADVKVVEIFYECPLAVTYDKGFLIEALGDEYFERNLKFELTKYNNDEAKSNKRERVLRLTNNLNSLRSDITAVKQGFIWENAPTRWKKYKAQESFGRKLKGFPCHINCLDSGWSGVQGGKLYVFWALPKVGKTVILMNIGYNLSRFEGVDVLFISAEMADDEFEPMYDARDLLLNRTLLKNANLAPSRKEEYLKGLRHQYSRKDKFKVIYPEPDFTYQDILSYIHDYKKTHVIEKGLVVIVDYLWLMDTRERYENQAMKYGIITKELRHKVAKKENVALITATQESRTGALKKSKGERRSQESVALSSQMAPHVNSLIHMDIFRKDEDEEMINKLRLESDVNREGAPFEEDVIYLRDFAYIGDESIDIVNVEEQDNGIFD